MVARFPQRAICSKAPIVRADDALKKEQELTLDISELILPLVIVGCLAAFWWSFLDPRSLPAIKIGRYEGGTRIRDL
jgi:hypothetical protein